MTVATTSSDLLARSIGMAGFSSIKAATSGAESDFFRFFCIFFLPLT